MANENMNTPTVTIDLSEYMALVECAVDLENIQKALYFGASLNYNETALRFNDDEICLFLNVVDGNRYEQRLSELKEEAAKKEADNGAVH